MTDIEEPLPEWAFKRVDHDGLQVGRQMLTKDGRIMGNGRIEKITCSDHTGESLFHIKTDAGNVAIFNNAEVRCQFWLGNYIIKPVQAF